MTLHTALLLERRFWYTGEAMELTFPELLQAIGDSFISFLGYTWWFWLFFVLLGLFRSAWLFWKNEVFEHTDLKWNLFELKIPREIRKSPKAMEQVLLAIHALRNTHSDFGERYLDGEITRWYTLELVSFGGEVHFYLRYKKSHKPLIQAAFFSYYPDVEVVDTEDYVDRLPANVRELYSQGYDLWGGEMVLAKEAMYPIRTYESFEAIEEEKQFDPMSYFLEVLGKAKPEEIVGIQFNCAPADIRWDEQFEHALGKLKETKTKKEKVAGADDEFGSIGRMIPRSPGETDILKAVENNLSRPAFETIARFLYLSPKKTFYDSYARRGITGAFNQYAAIDLNRFVGNHKMSTRIRPWNFPFVYSVRRNDYRKNRLLDLYRHRKIPIHTFIGKLLTSYILNWNFHSRSFFINVQCLATLYHPPTAVVMTAPHVKRVESRKYAPPAGMAIFGDEKDIEQFQ